jgi:tetratricopeptide (TPR) repeat protein
MSPTPPDRSETLPPELAERLDQICDRFEAAWKAAASTGRRPRIEEFLNGVPEGERIALLRELVPLDVHYRRLAGDRPRAGDYQGRFSGLDASCLAATFDQVFPSPADIGDIPPPSGKPCATAPPEDPYATLCNDSGGASPAGARYPPIPGYVILTELGRGGMGVVYKAVQIDLKRVVALKTILAGPHADDEALVRFRTEAEAIARLQHPHVVQIHDIGEYEGLPYIALEHCAGGSLASQLGGMPLPPTRAAELVEVLARAMQAAHEAGIIHRDLKPGNVLLTPQADHPLDPAPGKAGMENMVPKITDFGLAKKLDDPAHTRSGALIGTPSYMAPEQAEGRTSAIGPTTDVYALAAILYELLTGRPPFWGATLLDTLDQVRTREPVRPRDLQPKVSRDLETICLKGLRKEPGQRYASARALAEDLRSWLDGRPIKARPAPAWERGGKWVRRHPAAAALVGVTLLAACAFVAAIILYARNQTQQASILKQELEKFQEQEEVRDRSSRTLLRAQQHEVAGQWLEANTELAKAQEALDAQPNLRADELRAEVRQRLEVVRQQLDKQEQRRQARKRLMDFQAPYDNALFFEMLFTGLDLVENREKTRTAARAALAIYGLAGEPDPAFGSPHTLEDDRSLLSAAEHTQLVGACYELLLIWAEAEAVPAPGQVETEEQSRPRAENALSLLARAAWLGRTYGLETRTYHLRRARYLAQSRGEKFDPAQVEKTVPTKPAGALDWFLEGIERYRVGQYELAGEACREVLRQQERHFWARYVQALCHLREGSWAYAKAELTVCINQRPEFVWPKLLRGFAAIELGSTHPSEQLSAAEFRAAAEDLDSALRQDQDRMVRYVGLANHGVLNIRQKRWEEAIRYLQEAVKTYPEGYQGYVNLALALANGGKMEEALAALGAAIQAAPNEAVLYQSRAELQMRRKHWPEARADFERAIAREPPDANPDNLVELGKLLYRERKYREALASYDRALQRKPSFVLAQRYRAETLLALSREAEAGLALDRYLEGTQVAPAEVYQARGLIYADAGKLPDAVEMYTLALRQNPRDCVTRCCRGWVHLALDALSLALADFDACLREDPVSAEALAGRGYARIRLRQMEGALDDAKAAEAQGPLTDRLWYKITCIYAQVVGHLEAEARAARTGTDRLAARRLAVYREKALSCLNRTLEELPQEKRASFWRKQVQTDPALAAIRYGSWYSILAVRYSGGEP